MSVGLHEGLRSAGCAGRTVAEIPAAQPVWQRSMRARIVACQPLRDINAGRAVGVALGGVMVAARPDTVGQHVVLRPRALDPICRRSWRVCTLTRWIACPRRAGTPPFRSATRMRCHARCGSRAGGACRASVVVARAVRWAGVIPFSAVIAHSASMAGFHVSSSATAAVCFPRSEVQLSESDCYGIAAILLS